ncbi:hypothetical protein H0O02_03825 [Candidatus Micrarchaeota archaeon]|nr:hypothetical protein [Candidatus Micrarchaeota archaeon]
MRNAALLSLAVFGLLFLFGCASIESPFEVTTTQFAEGADVTLIDYNVAENNTVQFNMSRYLWAYYFPYAGDPDNRTVIAVEFDICGRQYLGSYPSNITIYYPQFGTTGQVLHAGQLNGCVHVYNDTGLLDSFLKMDSNPLQCCERSNVNKLVERYPKVYNATEAVELAIWDSARNVSGVNYTCFAGDPDRVVTGAAFADRNLEYGSPSIFLFTCPAYGAEGRYTVTVKQVATFDGAIYTWTDTPGYYTELVIANGGTHERFPLRMDIGSDSAGTIEVSNVSLRYNNRLAYDADEPAVAIGPDSTPIWASNESTLADGTFDAETDLSESDVDNCTMIGVNADNITCSDSTIIWSDITLAEIRNSTVSYTSSVAFLAYNSNITNADNIWYFRAYNATYKDGIVYDGIFIVNLSGIPSLGYVSAPYNYGCNGSGATWIFAGIDEVVVADANWVTDNDCLLELYDSFAGFGGATSVMGIQKINVYDSYFGAFDLYAPMVFDNAVMTLDNATFFCYNSSMTFNNSLTVTGTPRIWVIGNGTVTFSNLGAAYPEVWIVDNETKSEARLNNIRFLDHCTDCTLTSDYVLGERFVSFNDSAMPFINNTNATVVMYNVRGFSGNIYYYDDYAANIGTVFSRGALCDAARCTNIQYNATTGVLMFDVTGLSSYAAQTLVLGGGGGEERKQLSVSEEQVCPGNEIGLTAAYRGAPVSDVEVELMQYSPYAGVIATAYTDSGGRVQFTMPQEAVYRISFARSGYYYDNPYAIDYAMCSEEEAQPEEAVPQEQPQEEQPPAEQPSEQPGEGVPPEQPVVEEVPEQQEPGETTAPIEPPSSLPAGGEEAGAGAGETGQCANLFGICWYWLALLVIILAAGAVYFIFIGSRRR